MANFHLGYILWASVVAVLKLVLLTATGALMEKWGILNPQIRKSLSKMIFYVFTPCLIFVKIGDGITVDQLYKTWPLLVFPLAYALLSLILGYAAIKIFCMGHAPQYVIRSFVASLVFINAGNMPFTLIQSIARDVAPFSRDPKAEDRGIAFVAVYVAVSSTLLWTLGFHYLRKSETDELESMEPGSAFQADLHQSFSAGESFPQRSVEPSAPNLMDTVTGHGPAVGNALEALATPPSRKDLLLQVFNPTLLAIIAAIILVAISPVQRLFFTDAQEKSPPLSFLTEAMDQLGDTAIPLALLLLGGVLYADYASRDQVSLSVKIPKGLLITSCVIRLLIMPAAGFLMILPFLNRVITDGLLSFTILIESGMPAAVNLIVVSGMFANHRLPHAISTFLLWQYAASCITSIVLITASLALVL